MVPSFFWIFRFFTFSRFFLSLRVYKVWMGFTGSPAEPFNFTKFLLEFYLYWQNLTHLGLFFLYGLVRVISLSFFSCGYTVTSRPHHWLTRSCDSDMIIAKKKISNVLLSLILIAVGSWIAETERVFIFSTWKIYEGPPSSNIVYSI